MGQRRRPRGLRVHGHRFGCGSRQPRGHRHRRGCDPVGHGDVQRQGRQLGVPHRRADRRRQVRAGRHRAALARTRGRRVGDDGRRGELRLLRRAVGRRDGERSAHGLLGRRRPVGHRQLHRPSREPRDRDRGRHRHRPARAHPLRRRDGRRSAVRLGHLVEGRRRRDVRLHRRRLRGGVGDVSDHRGDRGCGTAGDGYVHRQPREHHDTHLR